ncbi:MAG: septum formation initiator family protein [Candidatus Thioglobus sp.]|uniref:FtsB family cell division protein n=1 Tax=Candidatus Thioglobus sp. TaxID=2026721 RepID=UPI002603068E|nr:septum formation initiator family protein [Candidatus Thioglobus sp.]MDC9726590.1 septum formation initiator family protein [Candidatus Thioglobus sp.]
MKIKPHLRQTQRRYQKPNSLFGFFYRYWISIILMVVLVSLFRQNFISNNFPFDVYNKQSTLDQQISQNQQLSLENQQLRLELAAKSDQKLEILESIARQKFGLIKSGERYYQISTSTPE